MDAIVFADITDPWAYVGATRFERAAATFTIISGEPVEIVLRAALQDIEVAPGDADVLNAGGTSRWDAGDDQRGRVTAAALKSGIDLNFDDLVPASSFDAWRLLTWASEFGSTTQRDLAQELWRGHFLEGVDIADSFALASRAALVGLDLETAEALLASDEYAEQVKGQSAAAIDVGVRHLPHVVVNATWTLAGIQTQNDYVQALHRIASGAQPAD
jgi:predicted DsbA family dithiol-disulfide isomerase